MDCKNDSDIIAHFKKLIYNLTKDAIEQEVILIFQSEIKKLNISYDKYIIESQFTKFLSRILAFTPKKHTINVFFYNYEPEKKRFKLIVINTGVDLSRLTELNTLTDFKTKIERINGEGTKFTLEIPLKSTETESQDNNNLRYTPYYLEINKRLTTYFSKIENLEKLAEEKSDKEGMFLRKINLIIKTYLHNNDFSVEKLSTSMALDRTQLYRKVKSLTQMSPSQYILFIRLQIARELLAEQSLGLNINEISYKVGFISNSHFSRAFKKQFGVNPSNYLKNIDRNNI